MTIPKITVVRIIPCLALIALFLSSFSLFAATLSISDFEQEIWSITNEQRQKYHLPALAYEDGLANLARLHSQNMIYYGFFSHKDRDGGMVSDRHDKYYPELILSSIGENLARFTNAKEQFSAREIVEGWMNSPEHRENILDPDYTHLGVGVVTLDCKLVATQNFATVIATLKSPLPPKLKRQETYRLEFAYLSPRPWQTFNAVLRYPDCNTKCILDDKRYILGGEPVKIVWLDEEHFALDIKFDAGKGNYTLNLGFNGGYFDDGVRLKVK